MEQIASVDNHYKGITNEQSVSIAANTAKIGITQEQANTITTNTTEIASSKDWIVRLKDQYEGINSQLGGIEAQTAERVAAIAANTAKVGITANQAEAITTNSGKVGVSLALTDAVVANTTKVGITSELTDAVASNTAKAGITQAQVDAITANTEKVESINALQSQMEAMTQQLNQLASQIPQLQASIEEKDEKIAELEKGGGQSLEEVLELVRDARAGSVVLSVNPNNNSVTLGLTIEQSDNLVEWTSLDGELTRTIPIPDSKKFYRFALDK